MKSKSIYFATVLALVTACISGINTFIAKIAVTGISDPILFTTLKNGIVAILCIGILIGFKKWPEICILKKRQWWKLLAIGIVGGSVPFALFFTGLAKTGALNAALIHKTLFLWVLILGIPFLHERLTRLQWLGVAALFCANLFVGGFSGFSLNVGELMILIATILWAVENIIAKKVLRDVSSSIVMTARMFFGSMALLGWVFIQSNVSIIGILGVEQWGWILLTSVLLFGYVSTWYTALKYAPATYVASILVSGTLITNILSAIFIKHVFTGSDFFISSLYAAGVVFLIVFTRKTGECSNLSITQSSK
ncbi:MAG: DMT family transporter [bacterium]